MRITLTRNMRNLTTSAILVMAACFNVGEPTIQADEDGYAYEIPKATAAAPATPAVPPVAGGDAAPERLVNVSEIQLPSEDCTCEDCHCAADSAAPIVTYVERQVCGPNGCRVVRVPVRSTPSTSGVTYANTTTTYASSSSSAAASLVPAATATFSGTPMQFQRGQPLRNVGRGLARVGWRLSGGAIRARRRCR